MTKEEIKQEMLKKRELLFSSVGVPKWFNAIDMWNFAYQLIEKIDEPNYLFMYDAGRHDAELPKYFWHTGEPTERGTYLVSDLVGDYAISYFDGKKFGYVKFPDGDPIKYWHKIPPYEEQK